MATVDTILRWLVRFALAVGLVIFVILIYSLRQTTLQQMFSSPNLGFALFVGGAWLIPALALRTWSDTTTGRQSILFYVLSLLSIGLIGLLGVLVSALENAF